MSISAGDQVVKTYGSYTALTTVSLTVEKGQAVALVDPSGSGNGTLLRCISALEAISSRTIRVDYAAGSNSARLWQNRASPAPVQEALNAIREMRKSGMTSPRATCFRAAAGPLPTVTVGSDRTRSIGLNADMGCSSTVRKSMGDGMAIRKIGVIGSGTIGRAIVDSLRQRSDVEIAFVLARDPGRLADLGLPAKVLLTDPRAALDRDVDLVIEAAMADVVRDLAPAFLGKADFCALSSTALAARTTEQAIREAAEKGGRRFYVPHGAVLGLDGLSDGRDQIGQVTITTTKSGKSLGLDPATEGTVFEGSARDACIRFPRNVNVHAAVALAGIGLDATVSRIVAVPGQETNVHRIEVTGQGLAWDLHITSQSLGGVTGSYTPASAIGSVARILGGAGICIV